MRSHSSELLKKYSISTWAEFIFLITKWETTVNLRNLASFFWILHRKIGFLIVFLSSLSQIYFAIQEVVPFDSIFLPENVLDLRVDNTVWKV